MRRRSLIRVLSLLAVTVFSLGLLYRYLAEMKQTVQSKFNGRLWNLPSKIYSDSFLLYPGLSLSAVSLTQKLMKIGYRPTNATDPRPGDFSYRARGGVVEIRSIGGRNGSAPGSAAIHFQSDVIQKITGNDGKEIGLLELEPELISGLYTGTWEERKIVSLNQIPPLLVQAIISTEDERFFRHRGIDPQSLFRALVSNVLHRRIVQGGSTLTQQLMKNFFLGAERTLKRKLNEAVMALIAEHLYSKDEILTNYLNEIYFGQKGAQGIFGVWEASMFYFSKEPHDLTLAEIATLAGLIKAPNYYSPYRDADLATRRRNMVAAKMLNDGVISQEQYAGALRETLSQRELHRQYNDAPYFIDFVRVELNKKYPPEVLTGEGLSIYTTLDKRLQKMAEEALAKGLMRLEETYPALRKKKELERLEGALLAIQPQTGEIKAMVGGIDYQKSQFNRAVQARRQAGSIFKPFVYLAALSLPSHPFRPNSLLDDTPFVWNYDHRTWKPENYGGEYHGRVTLRKALEKSLNGATARLAKEVGIPSIVTMARQMGITSPLPDVPSLALGSAEVTPLEVATAFCILANNGMRPEPFFIKSVIDAHGKTVEMKSVRLERVLSPETAYVMNHLLKGVLDRGTAASARILGFDRAAAGKTGTTNDYVDAWFVGYTPDLLALVWVGFDQREALGLSGAQAALPIWVNFMKQATADTPPSDFPVPSGIKFVLIDSNTGALATPYCPTVIREAFHIGDEPTKPCGEHPGPGTGEG